TGRRPLTASPTRHDWRSSRRRGAWRVPLMIETHLKPGSRDCDLAAAYEPDRVRILVPNDVTRPKKPAAEPEHREENREPPQARGHVPRPVPPAPAPPPRGAPRRSRPEASEDLG